MSVPLPVRAGALVAVVAVAGSCLFPTETGEQYRVEFATLPGLLFLGDTASVVAVVVGADGAARPDITVNYRSETPAIVDVDARTGLMRGVKEGAASIMAFAPGWEGAVPASDTVRVLVGSGSGIVNYGPRAVRFGDTVTVVGSDLAPDRLASLVFAGVGYDASEIVHRFAQGDRDTLVLWVLPPAPTQTSLLLVRNAGSAVVLPVQVEQADVMEPSGDGEPRRLTVPFRNPGLTVASSDVDVFQVALEAGMDVTVTLTAEATSSVELSVRRASTNSIIWPSSNRTWCHGASVFEDVRYWPLEEQRVALRQAHADTLMVRVVARAAPVGQTMRYGLSVDTAYLAATSVDDAEENDWCEVGLAVSSAVPGDTVAPTDTSMTLTFDNAPDLDWIRLDLDRPRVVTVWADPESDGPVPDIHLFRDVGNELLLEGQRAAHDTATAALDSLAVSVSAGSHALLLTNAVVGEPAEATGAYRLRIRTEQPIIAGVALQSGPIRIRSGLTTPLAAEARDQLGNVIADARLEWASTDTSVATVLSNGLVAAALPAEGTDSAYITVRSTDFPDVADSVPITVVRNDIVWTWVGGSSTPGQAGVYGTRGVTSGSSMPGARAGAVSWIDVNGQVWLFGGQGRDAAGNLGNLNDLWRFDGVNWTWVSGSSSVDDYGVYGTLGQPDPLNSPGARFGAVSWIDTAGDLWLFGGLGAGASAEGLLNDLWRFDGANWTWVAGSNGVNGRTDLSSVGGGPGGRIGAVSWIDGQDGLWLHGGEGRAEEETVGWLNDVWRFDGSAWEFKGGLAFINLSGTYNALGQLGSPGGRWGSVGWQDAVGGFWLFGGEGVGSPPFLASNGTGRLNDLWKWNGSAFLWLSGDSLPNQESVHGLGVPGDATAPGGRFRPVTWYGSDGALWLFGGEGTVGGELGPLQDLWRFDGVRWAWMAGSDQVDQPGSYGSLGVGGTENIPGGRLGAVSWTDAAGTLWLFGGAVADPLGNLTPINDLWKAEP